MIDIQVMIYFDDYQRSQYHTDNCCKTLVMQYVPPDIIRQPHSQAIKIVSFKKWGTVRLGTVT